MIKLHRSSRASTTAAIMVIGALVLGALSTLGVFFWEQNRVNDLRQELAVVTNGTGEATAIETTSPETSTVYRSARGLDITVYTPLKDQKVTSKLTIVGKVPGSWMFEASFPIKLIDGNGTLLAEAPGEALDDWMTNDLVLFRTELTFTKPLTSTGSLVLSADNPSGLAENDDTISIPVKF